MKTNFNFTKYKSVGFISVGLIILGFIYTFAVNGGFNLGIDFNPGINQQIKIDSSDVIDRGVVLDSLKNINGVQVQVVGPKDENRFVVKVQDSGDDNFQSAITSNIKASLDSAFGAGASRVLSTEFIGGSFSANLTNDVIFLTFFALLLIMVYVWIRFHFTYAISAITAIFHDVLFLLAFIGVSGLEVSTGTIAAVLTIIGYSLNDTIVIFDRVRENVKSLKGEFEEKVNKSLNETLSRTVITSLTTLIAVTFIFVFADGQIKYFALNLIVGIIIGTYSSIFIASSVVVVWFKSLSKKHENNIKNI